MERHIRDLLEGEKDSNLSVGLLNRGTKKEELSPSSLKSKRKKITKQEQIEALIEAEQLYYALLKKKALKSTVVFARDVLGYPDIGRIHQEWEVWAKNGNKKFKLFLVPRGHLKSTFWTISDTLRRIVVNPNIRILIANATLPNAKNFLGTIKRHIETNETFRRLYGSFDKNEKGRRISDDWSQIAMTVKRTKNMPEPTVTAVGVGGNVVSQHYDRIIWDDLVNDKNVTTKEQIDQMINWWKNSLSLLEADGEGIMIGTRWDFKDLYSYIAEHHTDDFNIFVRSCYKKDGTPYFEEKFSKDTLEGLKRQQGSYIFSCQYLNDPTDDINSPFKRKDRKYWDVLPDNLSIYIACDPSTGLGTDFTGIVVLGVSQHNDWYILDEYKKKIEPNEIVDTLWNVRLQYKDQFKRMTIEKDLYQRTLRKALQEKMRIENDFWSVDDTVASRVKSKEQRIMSLQPRYEQGTIMMHPKRHNLEYEMDRFPKMASESYDLLDALSMLIPIAQPATAIKTDNIAPRNSFLGVLTRFRKAKTNPEILGSESQSFMERFRNL